MRGTTSQYGGKQGEEKDNLSPFSIKMSIGERMRLFVYLCHIAALLAFPQPLSNICFTLFFTQQ